MVRGSTPGLMGRDTQGPGDSVLKRVSACMKTCQDTDIAANGVIVRSVDLGLKAGGL